MKHKYPDSEQPSEQCYDCGLKYDDPAWVDVLIPDEIWETINPTYHEGAGLLCFNCIARRCAAAGLDKVPVRLMSGALTNQDTDAVLSNLTLSLREVWQEASASERQKINDAIFAALSTIELGRIYTLLK